MTDEDRGSTSAMPQGDYSASAPGQYTSTEQNETYTALSSSADTFRLVAVGGRVTITYDPREHARRRLIRHLNER